VRRILRRPPVIGITTYAPDGDPPAFSLPTGYVRAVVFAQGIPILMAPISGDPDPMLDRVDGLMLAGGGDVDPALHRGGEHPAVYGVSRERDEFEIALVRRALERGDRPFVGICRGMQVLNIALGGDLELHIPDRRGEAVVHRLPPRVPTRHTVQLDSHGPLAEIYGRQELEVCSWHHQEVGRLGRGLRPVAHAPDGVIEGLVHDDHPLALGVQWHPELQIDDEPLQRRLFEWLVEKASKTG
jgi:putative glutamine amidotransferase